MDNLKYNSLSILSVIGIRSLLALTNIVIAT